jgi:nucleotide-binding universal stress UspA family protein
VEAASRYRIGRAWEVVAEAERQLRPDLVVIGARGRTAYSPPSLGSRADRMLRTACAPVLTVHASDKGRQSSIRTVLVATDFSEEAALATTSALRLARALPDRPRLVLVHAWQPLVDFGGMPVVDASLMVHLDDTMSSAEQLLDQAASALRGGALDVTAVVRQGYPAAIIEQEAKAAGADLIAVGTHGRSGLRRLLMGSIAERVVHHAPCPVLAVRRPDVTEPLRLSEAAENGDWSSLA